LIFLSRNFVLSDNKKVFYVDSNDFENEYKITEITRGEDNIYFYTVTPKGNIVIAAFFEQELKNKLTKYSFNCRE